MFRKLYMATEAGNDHNPQRQNTLLKKPGDSTVRPSVSITAVFTVW